MTTAKASDCNGRYSDAVLHAAWAEVLAANQNSHRITWLLGSIRQEFDMRLQEAQRAAVAELVEITGRVLETLELPALVHQSKKNENAGFIDWRDWCALRGEVMALRAAFTRVGGGK